MESILPSQISILGCLCALAFILPLSGLIFGGKNKWLIKAVKIWFLSLMLVVFAFVFSRIIEVWDLTANHKNVAESISILTPVSTFLISAAVGIATAYIDYRQYDIAASREEREKLKQVIQKADEKSKEINQKIEQIEKIGQLLKEQEERQVKRAIDAFRGKLP